MTDETEAPATDEPEAEEAPKAKILPKSKAPKAKAPAKTSDTWFPRTVFTVADEERIITELGGDPETDKLVYTPEHRDGVDGCILKLEA